MNKAVFLDRDGTINVDKAYLSKIEDFEYLPGVIDGLKLLQKSGYLLIIVTNQSGIARGFYSESDFQKLNDWMLNDLKNKGIIINKVYYCPHHPDGKIEKYSIDCNCRKPKLEMYYKAIEEFNIDISISYTIGDKIRDLALCENTDCKGFLISESEKKSIITNVKNKLYKNIRYKLDMFDAANEIVGGK